MQQLKVWTLNAAIAFSLGLVSLNAFAEGRNVAVHNPEQGLALRGYDPVSYFPEGGGSPLMGEPCYVFDYGGVEYHFASQANLDLFKANPTKFEPTYGRWCAFAMASGAYVDINPLEFTLRGHRLHFFVSARAKRNFDADVAGFETNADGHWKILSGEEPRL